MDICQAVMPSFFVRAASGLFDIANPKGLVNLLAAITDVSAIAVSPDGRTLAAALLRPQEIGLLDLRTQQQLMRFECDAQWIRSVEFSPDGRRLVAAGAGANGEGVMWEWTIHAR